MSDKPRRPWFQIHLSTAIVLMFVAGGLLWANLNAHPKSYVSGYEISEDSYDPVITKIWIRGWPFPCFTFKTSISTGNTIVLEIPTPQGHYIPWKVAADICIAFALLAASAFVCEWRIRRREARAP